MRKILLVHNYYQLPGGEDTVVANEKKLLEEDGNEVILYTRNNSEIKEYGFFKKIILAFSAVYNFKTYKDIKQIIREEQIDIVHVHNTLSLISPAVYYAAISEKVPVVQTVHNFRLLCPGATFYRNGEICEDCSKHGLKCALKYNCYRNSKLQTLACVLNTWFHRTTGIYGKINYICLSQFNKEKLLQLKAVNPEKVFVKPNFIDDPKLSYGKKDGFVFVGRLEETKGIMDLLNAWKVLGLAGPTLKVCGSGPLEEKCKAFIADNKLETVKMMGQLDRERVLETIGESKFLILPTKWYEGLPMVLIEAFSLGTPVIVPDMGNAGIIVTEGVNGYKFSPNSIDSLVDTVKLAMNSNDLTKSTRMDYLEKYTKEKNIEILNNIYDQCSNSFIQQ